MYLMAYEASVNSVSLARNRIETVCYYAKGSAPVTSRAAHAWTMSATATIGPPPARSARSSRDSSSSRA